MNNISLPESWADWHLTGILGEGAYGKVYRAEDGSGHVAAIKIFQLPQGAEVPETDLLPLLKDLPGIVRVEDYYIEEREGKSEGLLRMEYLTDLVCWSRKHPITEEDAISLMMDLCDSLTVCEQQGIIHRDIKPGNILITEEGHAKLGDFGVARIASPNDSDLSLAGTFRYMAPEIYHGNPYDHRADLYSLGMVFYELMNQGRIPFEEKGREQALKLRMDGTHFPKPKEATKGFGDILCRVCAYDQESRYKDARALKADLISLQKGCYRPSRNPLKILSKKELLIASVLLLIFCVAVAIGLHINAPIVPRESCGYGVSWVLKRNGTLEISGEGMMDSPLYNLNYTDSHREMLSHVNEVIKLEVKDNVRVVDLNGVSLPNLEEVVFSKSLDRITGNSFIESPKLRSIIFHGEDVDLGEYVFSTCPNLSEVILPSKLTKIPDGCFFQCGGLTDLSIPDTVTEIGENAFTQIPWYDDIYNSQNSFIVGDHCLVFWKGQEEELSITKETGISHIGAVAFSGSHLKSITMDDSVLTIGQGAFTGVPLENVVLPDHLDALPDYLFTSCGNLKTITLPESVKRIGQGAFQGCASLEEVRIPGTLESIGWKAFEGTPFKNNHTNEDRFTVVGSILIDYQGNDTDLKIPDSLEIKRIGESFLEQNQKLKSVTLPEGLAVLEEKCFFMCPNLENVTFPKSLKTIGQGSFVETLWWREQLKKDYIIVNDLLLYCCSEDSTIVIPENLPVKKIVGGAFHKSLLQEITISTGILEIEEGAFDDCVNLREVHLRDTWSEEEIRKCFYKTPWYYLRK